MKTLAERLKLAMEEATPKKMKGVELARCVGVKPPSVSDWLSGKSKTMEGENLLKAATCLGVNALWLASGTGEMRPSQTQHQFQSGQSQSQSLGMPQQQDIRDLPVRHDGLPPSKQTPVISWVSAGDYTEVLSGDLSRVIEWIPYNPKAGKYGFALIVDGVSMEPKFMPDDRIYVNPTFQIDELHTGDLVIMACDGDEKATFKELVVEDGNYYLRPLNPNWQPRLMPVNEHCRLVGKVVGRFNDFD
ncbi:XRE family transcriptional regulator [Alkanindiges illinoisensis]|uniref:XRE family transcriptional regulator n=1 Tax=Alkanindiges illinoisensis TaxID=197183 RepID=UPI000478FE33|nr:XRE family transcriptional regulator [Alkanindiges illinoisensis]